MNVIYRNLELNEASDFWNMMNALDHETRYMMYEAGERTKDIKRIENLIQASTSETYSLYCCGYSQ